MKNLKKLFALLLCLALVFVMTSCVDTITPSSDDDDDDEKIEEKEEKLSAETIQGEWIAAMDFEDWFVTIEGDTLLNLTVAEIESTGVDCTGFEFNEKCDLNFVLDFVEDEVECYVDDSNVESYVNSMVSELVDYICQPEVIADMLGMELPELEVQLEVEGMTMDDLIASMLESMGTKEAIVEAIMEEYGLNNLSELAETFEYEINEDDDVVIIDDEEYVYEKGDLVYVEAETETELVFEKQ